MKTLRQRCASRGEREDQMQLVGDAPDSDRTMVRRAVRVPGVHEGTGADGKAISAVGVADLKDETNRRNPLGKVSQNGPSGKLFSRAAPSCPSCSP